MTPLQELIKLETDLTNMFDSDYRVSMAILEHIRSNKKEMLKKEKEQIMDAFEQGENNSVDYFVPENNIKESEQYYNETFNNEI